MTIHSPSVASQGCFESSVLPLATSLYGSALQLCRNADDARDLVQETVVRAWRYWPSFQTGSNLGAWLRRILTNAFINECRKGARLRRLTGALQQARPAGERMVVPRPEEQDFGDEVRAALQELSPEFQQVLLLVDVHDFSYAEAAAWIGCPVGTIMSRLHRARGAMRAKLTGYARAEGYVHGQDERPDGSGAAAPPAES